MNTPTPNPRPDDLALIRVALAAEDVNWGYDHGFSTRPDEETDAFARAVLAALDLPARDARIRAEVAGKIRAELVCCDMYDQVQLATKECERRSRLDCVDDPDEHLSNYHAICHWSEAAARIAEDHATPPAVRPAVASAVPAEGSGLAAMLRAAAAGRREYAENAPDPSRAVLEQEAATLESAARLADGDMEPMYGWLPAWRWTSEMFDAPPPAEGSGHPQPAECGRGVAGDWCARPTGHDGPCNATRLSEGASHA